jgi:hypothetical protein
MSMQGPAESALRRLVQLKGVEAPGGLRAPGRGADLAELSQPARGRGPARLHPRAVTMNELPLAGGAAATFSRARSLPPFKR